MIGLKSYDKLLLLVNFYFYLSHYSCNAVQNNSFSPPQLRSGGWTPIPLSHKNLNVGNGDKIVSESIQVSAKIQQTPEHKKTQDSEMLPIPVIKPHRHGATLGFDLPEQGLTLYLDINELATKPMASNIGLKVVSHDNHQAQQSQTQTLNHVKPTTNLPARHNSGSSSNNQLYNSGKESPLSQFVSKMQNLNNNKNNNNNNNNNNHPKASPITVAKIQKRVKSSRNFGSYEGNGGAPAPVQKLSSISKPVMNKYHVGYVRPHELQNALKHVGLTHSNDQINGNNNNNNHNNNGNNIHRNNNNNNINNNNNNNNNANPNPSTRTVIINTHSLGNNLNYEKLFNEPQKKVSPLDTFKQDPSKYFGPLPNDKNFVPQTNINTNQQNDIRPAVNSAAPPSSYTYSSQQMPIRPSIQFPVQEQEKERPQPEQPVQQTSQEDDFENEVTIKRTTTSKPPVLPPQQGDEQLKGFDDDIEQTTEAFSDNRFEEPQRQISNGVEIGEQLEDNNNKQITPSLTTPASKQAIEDDTIIKPFPAPQPQELIDIMPQSCPVQQMCQQICDAKTDNLISEASNIREIIQKLKADAIVNAFPSIEEELQNVIDFASSEGYTIILPSNEAVSRLPPNLFEYWKNNVNTLAPLLDNHVIDRAQSLEEMRLADIIQPRSGSKLRVQRAHNDSYTINGERVMIANQVGPSGGQIHVIDGILYPNSDKDIMETLKSCNRLDGFVTLAEGTGFSETLKESECFPNLFANPLPITL